MSKKNEGLYLHAQDCLPYALTFQDLNLLSCSDDIYAHYFLAKIICLYPQAFSDTNSAVKILSELLAPVLEKAFFNGDFSRGLRLQNPGNNGYAERVFNSCCFVSMQCSDGVEAELAFAMLLCKLATQFSKIPPMLKIICAMATEFAHGHFFSIILVNQYISTLMCESNK